MPQRFVRAFLATGALFALVVACYFAFPKLFFFRAWEFFTLFVHEGYADRSQAFRESGDSARNYLFQRHVSDNRVSVNALGDRSACYEERPQARPRVLVVGDSQLYGMGTSDEGTLPAQLCRLFGAAIYNSAGRSGLEILRHPDYRFDAVLFTRTERAMVNRDCDDSFEKFGREGDALRSRESFLLPEGGARRSVAAQAQAGLKHLSGVITSRARALLLGRWRAPESHLDITAPHRVARADAIARNVDCARRIEDYFRQRGLAVGFLVFPAHQTIYPAELGLRPDAATLGFIDELSRAWAKAGVRSFNSKQCLQAAAARGTVYHPHDTHLNALGYQALAECLRDSRLAPLFRRVAAAPAARR